MTREARHLRCPENVLGWIPWYADGSLTEREKGAVEAHASECPDCRAELDMIAGAPFEIDFELPDPERVFAEITARIAKREAGPAVSAKPSARPPPNATPRSPEDATRDWKRIADWVRSDAPDFEKGETGEEDTSARGALIRGPWLGSTVWAAAAAVVLLSLGALAGAMFSGPLGRSIEGDVYRTASAPVEGGAMRAADAASVKRIDVVFHESATAREIARTLHAIDAEIVAGPTGLGVYRIALSSRARVAGVEAGADAHRVEEALVRLKAVEGGVAIFAEVVP